MRKLAFGATFVVVVVVQFTGVLALNLVANPRAEFPTRLVTPLVDDSHSEKTVAFRALAQDPKALILGSSRMWTAPPSALGEGAFNFAVSGGTMREALRAYRFVLGEGANPSLLVVGAEDWMFVPWSQTDWDPADDPALADVSQYGGDLVSSYEWAYLRDSWKAVRYEVVEAPPRHFSVRDDGAVVYERAETEMLAGTFNWSHEFERNLHFARGVHDRFSSPDPEYLDMLDEFLLLAREHDARVVLVMTPILRETIEASSPATFQLFHDATLRELVARCARDVSVFDFTDYRSFGGDRDDFVDGWHQTARNGGKMLRALDERELDHCPPNMAGLV